MLSFQKIKYFLKYCGSRTIQSSAWIQTADTTYYQHTHRGVPRGNILLVEKRTRTQHSLRVSLGHNSQLHYQDRRTDSGRSSPTKLCIPRFRLVQNQKYDQFQKDQYMAFRNAKTLQPLHAARACEERMPIRSGQATSKHVVICCRGSQNEFQYPSNRSRDQKVDFLDPESFGFPQKNLPHSRRVSQRDLSRTQDQTDSIVSTVAKEEMISDIIYLLSIFSNTFFLIIFQLPFKTTI